MDPQQRTAQTLRSMVPGTLGGRVNSAAPVQARKATASAKQPAAIAAPTSGGSTAGSSWMHASSYSGTITSASDYYFGSVTETSSSGTAITLASNTFTFHTTGVYAVSVTWTASGVFTGPLSMNLEFSASGTPTANMQTRFRDDGYSCITWLLPGSSTLQVQYGSDGSMTGDGDITAELWIVRL